MEEGHVSVWAPTPWFLVTPPQQQNTVTSRHWVTRALGEAIATHQVTVVTAVAGMGKTTALSEWARRSTHPVAWLSLTRYDDDPFRLFSGILSAFHRLATENLDPDLEPLLALSVDPRDPTSSQNQLLDAIAGLRSTVVLVIDDAHLAGKYLSESVVGDLVDRALPALRLVLAGRSGFTFAFSRSLLYGSATTIDAETLSFTVDEIEVAGVSSSRAVDSAAAMAIRTATRGWPVAVRLALLSPDDTGSRDLVTRDSPDLALLADYVSEEVLHQLSPDLADFVLTATMCSRVDATIAAALSSRPDSGELLEECVRRGLFLDRFTTDDNSPVYRWHSVFADQCRSILRRRDPRRAGELNRRAAEQLARRYPMEAVLHALRGDAPALAARIIEDNWLGMIIHAHATLLAKTCLALPSPWVDDPAILLIRACCLDLTSDRTGGSVLFDRATAAIESAEPIRQRRLRLTQALATLIVADERDRLIAACDQVEAALRGKHELSPAMAACVTFVLAWTTLRLRRDPPRAIQFMRSALTDCEATGQHVVARRVAVNLTFALAFAGEFNQAMDVATRTVAVPQRGPWHYPERALSILAVLSGDRQISPVTTCMLVVEAMIRLEQGDLGDAHALLERSLEVAAPQQIRRPYVDAGSTMRVLLGEHAHRGTRHDVFVGDLLTRWTQREQERKVYEPLSRREREIVGYLHTTMTNVEIARVLYVSVNTLKTHLRAIYRKLGVANRRDAVRAYSDISAESSNRTA
jgi:LuxR family transcriptional regulator, maltose regulon positive regulatory protein